ncbi:MAG: c-type cytochrome biogenesis protein CcsB [Mariprofundaceae bacterium]|nr:c-type cytochrome biogenesis protein CcsB [Mariprofundaceae bacterium]
MSTIATAFSSSGPLFQGRFAHLRCWAYLGMMLGMSAMAIFAGDGYVEDNYIFQLFSLEGVKWMAAGAVVGLAYGFTVSPTKFRAYRFSEILVPWLDGVVLLVALMGVYTLFEPSQAMISYEDQSNLVSGRIVMAMNVLLLFSAICYVANLFAPEGFMGNLGTATAWAGVYAGGSALLLRWYESYLLMDEAIGHAPVSNLYEVFILLFCVICVIYLTLESRHQAHAMGAFVLPIVACGVFFSIWLESIGQNDIKPLVPALQSYWMKIHVPLNFVGYGAFAVACAAGMAWLTRDALERRRPQAKMLSIFPSLKQLDHLAYKSVAIGFPAFTLATILGAAWAAEAWGGYWSWDPKETWALIVWLVYGAYLHARFSRGLHGKTLAWWTVIGFFVTIFCFVGVNMYLSGLHSYGQLT